MKLIFGVERSRTCVFTCTATVCVGDSGCYSAGGRAQKRNCAVIVGINFRWVLLCCIQNAIRLEPYVRREIEGVEAVIDY